MSYFRFLLTRIKNDQKPKVEHKHSVPRKKKGESTRFTFFCFLNLERSLYSVLPERYREWLELQQLLNHGFVRHSGRLF